MTAVRGPPSVICPGWQRFLGNWIKLCDRVSDSGPVPLADWRNRQHLSERTMSVTIHEVLADLRAQATSESQKGALFEDLIAKYLRTDPQYAAQFAKVWRWMEWPGRQGKACLLYTSPSPRDRTRSRMPSSA